MSWEMWIFLNNSKTTKEVVQFNKKNQLESLYNQSPFQVIISALLDLSKFSYWKIYFTLDLKNGQEEIECKSLP